MAKKKINLLVVDDEEDFLRSIKKRLEVRDFNVTTVNRGDLAIEAVRNQPVDVVLLDLKMPGMNGEQTLAELKREDEAIEVIILTGHGSMDSVIDCTKKGAYFYLQKPCELERLLAVLAEAYKKRAMNTLQIKQERMEEILKMADSDSPLSILRKIKELEKEKR